ncbi:MAG: prepilin-type N-terminal cleavage/methylation domain-containing protein [Desulforhopalus sp.]|nr:prepilin-type N-terminal cleavage/methylation domain-containing protein [Desulforhopalus sp.]
MKDNFEKQHGLLIGREQGFTLIETIVAIFILTVGIFALYSMQTTSIRYNAFSSAMTTSSTWASDRIEELLALDYDDPLLRDDDDATDLAPLAAANGDAGLNHTDGAGESPDGRVVSPDQRYTVFWNIASRISPNPNDPTVSTVKAIRVIVKHTDYGINKQVTMNYFKQKLY